MSLVPILGAGSADARLNIVVVALLVLAGIITVTTIFYWRLTRPEKSLERPGTAKD